VSDRIELEGFADLVASAQVGTRKAVPTRKTEFPLEETERTVLLELGTLALVRRAGSTGVRTVSLPPAPAETLRIADAADALEEALDESVSAALEWAREAADRGFVAPTSVVSRLVPLVKRHPEFGPVLGERGRWLAGVMGVELNEPTDVLPDKEDWGSLDPKERVRLVEDGPGDLELFAKALGDRRKEVRETAAERLIRMPESPQAQELTRMALAAVVLHKGLLKSSLEVSPPKPELLPKWMPQDYPTHGMGGIANALRDLLARVPPSLWGESPERLLDLSKRSEYADALRLGWERATVRFGDVAWGEALFLRFFGSLSPFVAEPIVNGVSEAVFDREIVARLRGRDKAMSTAFDMLRWRAAPFSASLSREIVAIARAIGGSHYVLESLGTRLDLSALPLLNDPWDEGLAEELRLKWRKILDLRRRLHESLR